MTEQTLEARIILAIKAHRTTPRLTIRCAAKLYDIPRSTLQHRIAGRASKADKKNGKSTLTLAEEAAIVEYVFDLDLRGFSPRRADVEDMANRLLEMRGARYVGKNWTDRFIKRRPELRTRFSRAYDYQRALQDDPQVLNAWFLLVTNMRAKYAIQDCDFYNFDETGFAMGMIRPGTVVPTPIITSVEQLAKATVAVSHQLTLLVAENKSLREANEALSKRRRAKRTRLQDTGPLTGEEASQLLVEKGVVEQEGRDKGAGEGSSKRRKTSARHCGICGKAGHNARTCPEEIDASSSSDSE